MKRCVSGLWDGSFQRLESHFGSLELQYSYFVRIIIPTRIFAKSMHVLLVDGDNVNPERIDDILSDIQERGELKTFRISARGSVSVSLLCDNTLFSQLLLIVGPSSREA